MINGENVLGGIVQCQTIQALSTLLSSRLLELSFQSSIVFFGGHTRTATTKEEIIAIIKSILHAMVALIKR